MKAIVDKNGNIYNRFDRTNEIEYIKKIIIICQLLLYQISQ